MAKKRKPINKVAQARWLGAQILKPRALVNVIGLDKTVKMFNIQTWRDESSLITRDLADLVNRPWKWRVTCSVICRDQMGNNYESNIRVDCQNAHRHSDETFLELLNDQHQALIAKANRLHLITCAWIAQPIPGRELTDDQTFEIYKLYGAFEHLSKFENDNEVQTQITKLKQLVG